ncbi:ATP-binding protein [Microbacterium sp.]|uniref:ATP-binding protein n=1 Tax=Microbacterium sp. TaxID=51671 RepID=UPI0039E323E8
MDGYRQRIVDRTLDEVFPHLAAIALEGAKAVGKTATATQRARTVLSMTTAPQRAALAGNLDLVTAVDPPVLVDEWQLVPDVWDRVRDAVDADRSGGRFLLTGSASPAPGLRVHSGAGRIVSLRMRPLTVAERGISDPTVSVRELLRGSSPKISGHTSLAVGDYADEILRSGFPGIRDLPERARDLQLDGYVSRVIDRELPENGMTVRRPAALRAWLAAYAAATASTASYTTLLDAATAGDDDKPARQTVAQYRDYLQRAFILDPVEAWMPAFAPLKRLGASPKHHLVDPAIAARLVGVGKQGLLVGEGAPNPATGTWLGALFESLVTQSVRVYAEAADSRIGHLRTRDGDHEIDLVIESPDRSCIAIEVKLSDTVHDTDVRHLAWLQRELGDRLIDRIVVNTGPYAYRRPDGIAVVPLALLGP